MRSCEHPLKRSARDAMPSSVSKRYSLSIRTQGSLCRHCASSSLRRVSSFSALSSSSRPESHSSRVPILWSVIVFLLLATDKQCSIIYTSNQCTILFSFHKTMEQEQII